MGSDRRAGRRSGKLDEGRCGHAAAGGIAGGGHVVENVPALEAKGCDGGEHALDEDAAGVALGAEARAAPDDTVADTALGLVVGGLDARDGHEGPHRGLEVQERRTHALSLAACGQRGALCEEPLHLGPDLLLDQNLELRPGQVLVTNSMPCVEQVARAPTERLADRDRRTAGVRELLEVANEMGPAQLPLVRWELLARIPFDPSPGSPPTPSAA